MIIKVFTMVSIVFGVFFLSNWKRTFCSFFSSAWLHSEGEISIIYKSMIDSTKLTCTYETRPLNCCIKSDFSSQLKDLGERKGVRVATAVIIQYANLGPQYIL